ncbi:uncharacterized protein TNCV_3580941 [Trichonephila clavipes]|nr:uncharacterized protein TNCV_3580941 [Trichonephila clavipes]
MKSEIEEIRFFSKGSSGNKGATFDFIENYKSLELHGFSDASEKAICASIYLRCTKSSEQSSMRFICSKSRITPVKRISIPRLELCAAGLLSKLVKKSVTQIQEITKSYCWQHIRSEQYTSDLVSRRLGAEILVNCKLWWKGPETFCYSLSRSEVTLDPKSDDFTKGLKKDSERTLKLTLNSVILDNLLNFTNNYLKVILIFSFVLRRVQVREFSEDFKKLERSEPVSGNSKSKSLNPFVDDKGIIRVGGRLGNSELDYGTKYPIVLPANFKFTYILLLHLHSKFYHLGP